MPFDWCTFLIGPPGVIIVSLKMMRTENIENDDSDDGGDSDCAYQFKRKNTALQTV